jgi:hypothetical protein
MDWMMAARRTWSHASRIDRQEEGKRHDRHPSPYCPFSPELSPSPNQVPVSTTAIATILPPEQS